MALAQSKLSLFEFLDWENQQAERHELFRGEVFAMVGVRRVHGVVAGNVFASLKQQLKGTPCHAFTESLKVQVADDTIFYPDVFVTCDAADLKTDYIFKRPSLVVEVLSESTPDYDRGLKFALYRRLESLQEYLLIHPDSRLVELLPPGCGRPLHPVRSHRRPPLSLALHRLRIEPGRYFRGAGRGGVIPAGESLSAPGRV